MKSFGLYLSLTGLSHLKSIKIIKNIFLCEDNTDFLKRKNSKAEIRVKGGEISGAKF